MLYTPLELSQHLKQIPLFQPLELERLTQALRSGEGLLQRPFDAGEVIYKAGDYGSSVFVVLQGRVSLRALRRGEVEGTQIRQIPAGDFFGEEPLLSAGRRSLSAVAETSAMVLELSRTPIKRLFQREQLRSHFEQELERLRGIALRERLRGIGLFKPLTTAEVEELAAQVRERQVHRAATVYREGDSATHVYVLVEGTVTLGRQVGGMQHIRAWLGEGDCFGELEVLAASVRTATATAQTSLTLIEFPAAVLLELRRKYPTLGDELRRLTAEKHLLARSLGDPLADLLKQGDRMGVAQSMLIIDLSTCIRCGNCAWSCEQTHGQARLVRRGETLEHSVPGEDRQTRSLLPSSCQHCTDAACMSGCPTGAIARELDGEVFIRDETCIGCGDCSKRCPWGNISITPVEPDDALRLPGGGRRKARAVKCDNCRHYSVSACVHNCPTGAMQRVNPATWFPELATLAGLPAQPMPRPTVSSRLAQATLPLVTLGLPLAALVLGLFSPAPLRGGSSLGLLCGAGALLLLLLTVAYSARKRLIRWVMKLNPRKPERAASLAKPANRLTIPLRRWLPGHIFLAMGACLLAGVHSGGWAASIQGMLLLVLFYGVMVTGIVGALLYRWVPPLLSALEDTPSLVEDLTEQEEGIDKALSELVVGLEAALGPVQKRLERQTARPFWLWHIYRQRLSRAQLTRRLQADLAESLQPLTVEHRLTASKLLELLVHRRHVRAQRLLQVLLRAWLVPHILAAVALCGLLVLHLIQVVLY